VSQCVAKQGPTAADRQSRSRDELCHGSDGAFGGRRRPTWVGQQHFDHGHSSGGKAGAVMVTVTVSGHSGSLTMGSPIPLRPTVSGVSPNSGSTAGGNSSHDHRDKLRHGSYRDGWRNGATSVVVGERNANHGHDPAGSAGAVTVTVTNLGRTEREPSQRVTSWHRGLRARLPI